MPQSYSVTDTEFRIRLVAAKEARHLTVDEMSHMCKISKTIMEGWLAGASSPRRLGRENILRAVE